MHRLLNALLLASLAPAAICSAEIVSPTKNLVILEPRDLPAGAQIAGQSMKLFALNNGKMYLYIEEQQVGGIAIFDVTEPRHIQQVGFAKLNLPASFEFGPSLHDSAVLLAFFGDRHEGVLDLRNPRQPSYAPSADMPEGSDADQIGSRGLLLISGARPNLGTTTAQHLATRDYRVFDDTNPEAMKLLDTVHDVRQDLQNEETGTTFLLGKDGLTLIRRPSIELQHWLWSTYTN